MIGGIADRYVSVLITLSDLEGQGTYFIRLMCVRTLVPIDPERPNSAWWHAERSCRHVPSQVAWPKRPPKFPRIFAYIAWPRRTKLRRDNIYREEACCRAVAPPHPATKRAGTFTPLGIPCIHVCPHRATKFCMVIKLGDRSFTVSTTWGGVSF